VTQTCASSYQGCATAAVAQDLQSVALTLLHRNPRCPSALLSNQMRAHRRFLWRPQFPEGYIAEYTKAKEKGGGAWWRVCMRAKGCACVRKVCRCMRAVAAAGGAPLTYVRKRPLTCAVVAVAAQLSNSAHRHQVSAATLSYTGAWLTTGTQLHPQQQQQIRPTLLLPTPQNSTHRNGAPRS
jgi:hypothetical protein